jgi:hypothetical protein
MARFVGWVSVAPALSIGLDLDPRVTHHCSAVSYIRAPFSGVMVGYAWIESRAYNSRSRATLTHSTTIR